MDETSTSALSSKNWYSEGTRSSSRRVSTVSLRGSSRTARTPCRAGKSTAADKLAALVPGSRVLPMDGFHFPQAQLVSLGRRERMGAPDTFDAAGYAWLKTWAAFYGWIHPAPMEPDGPIPEPWHWEFRP